MAKTNTTSKRLKPSTVQTLPSTVQTLPSNVQAFPSTVQALPATLAIQPGMVPTKIVKENLGHGITRITTYANKD